MLPEKCHVESREPMMHPVAITLTGVPYCALVSLAPCLPQVPGQLPIGSIGWRLNPAPFWNFRPFSGWVCSDPPQQQPPLSCIVSSTGGGFGSRENLMQKDAKGLSWESGKTRSQQHARTYIDWKSCYWYPDISWHILPFPVMLLVSIHLRVSLAQSISK